MSATGCGAAARMAAAGAGPAIGPVVDMDTAGAAAIGAGTAAGRTQVLKISW